MYFVILIVVVLFVVAWVIGEYANRFNAFSCEVYTAEIDRLRAELAKCFRLMLKIRAGELLPRAQKECNREIERLRKVVGE